MNVIPSKKKAQAVFLLAIVAAVIVIALSVISGVSLTSNPRGNFGNVNEDGGECTCGLRGGDYAIGKVYPTDGTPPAAVSGTVEYVLGCDKNYAQSLCGFCEVSMRVDVDPFPNEPDVRSGVYIVRTIEPCLPS